MEPKLSEKSEPEPQKKVPAPQHCLKGFFECNFFMFSFPLRRAAIFMTSIKLKIFDTLCDQFKEKIFHPFF